MLPLGDPMFANWSLFLTNRMHEAGVPFGAGTDVPINLSIPGYSLHSELDMLGKQLIFENVYPISTTQFTITLKLIILSIIMPAYHSS